MENICFSFSFNQNTLTLALSVVVFLSREVKYPLHITFFLFHVHMSARGRPVVLKNF